MILFAATILIATTRPNIVELPRRKTTEPVVHVFDRRGRTRKHTFRVRIELSKFDPKYHKVKWSGVGSERYIESIDRRGPYGAIHVLPDYGMSKFQGWIDGKPFRVPRKLWSDCYDLNVSRIMDRTEYQFLISRDGSRITLRLGGGDGMAGYTMTWTLRRTGKSSRKPTFS